MFLYILICEYLHLRYDTSHQNKSNKLLEYINNKYRNNSKKMRSIKKVKTIST
jgi:hypothetical protein